MKTIEKLFNSNPKYMELLDRAGAIKLLKLFKEIQEGKYDKGKVHEVKMKHLVHPIYLRSIRADMQSFVNTFIDPYLEKKPYLSEVDFVIDAGANIGYTAVLFATWWPESTIISVEPDKENYELTLKNTMSYPNIKVMHAALWNKESILKIEAGQEDGFVVREFGDEGGKVKQQNLTRGVSIQQLLKRYNKSKVDFLKLNIEGSEKEVFSENYDEWLPNTKTILVELHDGKNPGCSKAVFTAINQYDFSVAETASYGILFSEKSNYSDWYAKWYKEEIYGPNINKERFPRFYLDK